MKWKGEMVTVDLVGLTRVTGVAPLSYVTMHLVSHEPVTHQMLHRPNTRVGETLQQVKDKATSVLGNDWAQTAS